MDLVPGASQEMPLGAAGSEAAIYLLLLLLVVGELLLNESFRIASSSVP
jgi:hypothetical protein